MYKLNSRNTNGNLQTRMERTTAKVNYSSTNYVSISGDVRIFNAGDTGSSRATYGPGDMRDTNGTYIAQVKGQHNGGGGSDDPAIMLFIAKPVRRDRTGVPGGGSVIKITKWGKRMPKEFDIYRETIDYRGGEGRDGRSLTHITRVSNGQVFNVDIKSEFKSNNSHEIYYNINGSTETVTVPGSSTQNPKNTKIRMGAYRCKGGYANIQWRDVSTNKPYIE